MKKLIWFALAMMVCACGKESTDTNRIEYTLNENGCSTGTHRFSARAEMCAALKDDDLNRNCAWSSRKAKYEMECGTDWAFYNGN